MIHDSIIRDRLVTGDKTASDVTRDIARPILNNPSTAWKVGFTLSLIFLGIFGVSLLYTLFTGIGVWNINKISDVGLGYHQLRILGWYWSRRYLDLSRVVAVPSEMADEY